MKDWAMWRITDGVEVETRENMGHWLGLDNRWDHVLAGTCQSNKLLGGDRSFVKRGSRFFRAFL
jgi:hypothetical protein